jgi:hypothetical protein
MPFPFTLLHNLIVTKNHFEGGQIIPLKVNTKFVDMDFTYPTSSFFAQKNELTSYKNVLTQPDFSN